MIPALGLHNVSNALAAIAVAYDQGLTLDDIRCGLLTYEGLAMRQQIHELDKITVIDDSYNASPDSIKSGIGVLMAVKSTGKKIAAVSYTHLDVYKRQVYESGRRLWNQIYRL